MCIWTGMGDSKIERQWMERGGNQGRLAEAIERAERAIPKPVSHPSLLLLSSQKAFEFAAKHTRQGQRMMDMTEEDLGSTRVQSISHT